LEYHGSSTDEIALVKKIKEFGYQMVERTSN
jgi:hypothetical protein